ncbi:MAG TPA: response regulator [Herpetosiphonaceae bacterium]
MRPQDATVLVIDDNMSNLLVAKDLLAMSGVANVHTTTMGWQGLQLARSLQQLDLILLDIQMPQEDGFAILHQIRKDQQLRDTRVVAVTITIQPHDEAKLQAAGFNGFICKPLDYRRFPEQLAALLDGKEVWTSR